jgi:hypothetical protein
MRRFFAFLLLFAAAPALASDGSSAPPSGTGGIITGSILTGVGALNLVTSPVCVTDVYGEVVGSAGQSACLVSSLVIGGGMVAVGVPVLLVGLKHRQDYRAWKDASAEAHVGLVTDGHASMVVVSGSF